MVQEPIADGGKIAIDEELLSKFKYVEQQVLVLADLTGTLNTKLVESGIEDIDLRNSLVFQWFVRQINGEQ